MLSDPLIASSGQFHSSFLYDLDNDHQNGHRKKHHFRLIPVIAVFDGYISQSAAAYKTGHCGISQNGGDGKSSANQKRRLCFRKKHFPDNLKHRSPHGLCRFNHPCVNLFKRRFHHPGHIRSGGDNQRGNNGFRTQGSPHQFPGNGKHHN